MVRCVIFSGIMTAVPGAIAADAIFIRDGAATEPESPWIPTMKDRAKFTPWMSPVL